MTATDTAPQTTHFQTDLGDASACADGAEDWVRPLLERQLWMLGRLAEGGLEIAQAIERQATGSDKDGPAREVVKGDIVVAYARVARAVRLTIMLQSKVIQDLQRLESNAEIDARCDKRHEDADRPGLQRQRKTRIKRIVGRIAWAERQDMGEAERLMREAGEHLEQDDVYGDVLSRPASELIALICQALGLEPDWPQLAAHAWAQEEINSGAAGSPFAALLDQGLELRPLAPAMDGFTPRAASP